MKRNDPLSVAIGGILDGVETLIKNSAKPAARASRLARAECEIAAGSRGSEPASRVARAAKLAEAERDVTQQSAVRARNAAVYRAQMARRGW